MATEEWLVRFGNSLKEYARVLADELKETHPEAEERALTFSFLTPGKFCPECWVRYGRTSEMREKRWLIGCDEHEFSVPSAPGT